MSTYSELYRRSQLDPEGFWKEAAQGLDWVKPADRVLDLETKPVPRWFVGGRLNTCHNAVDRHIAAGRGEQPALIYDSPVTGRKKTYSYRELQREVALFAGGLADQGVGIGDRG